jgi:hypothetical protein
MKHIQLFESFVEQTNESKVRRGLMHKLLKIEPGTTISSVYSSGEELAKDLMLAAKRAKLVPVEKIRRKVTSMLAYAANWPGEGENTVLDKALRAASKIEVRGVPNPSK